MSKLEHALALAAKGFWVFPLKPNSKTPAHKGWQSEATRDPVMLNAWFLDPATSFNIGISTGKFGDDGALLVVDVDTKNGKDGNATLIKLELEGSDLPDTAVASTPSGGRHLFYRVERAVRQGTDILGKGLDVRSRGGYVVGAGSTVDGREYSWISDIAPAPAVQWLVDRCGERVRVQRERPSDAPVRTDLARAVDRGRRYLENDAPLADDPDAYIVACRLKDFGVPEDEAIRLMQTYWDPRCDPPRTDNTVDPVRNAYRYGQEPQGVAAPEADFTPVAENNAEFSAQCAEKGNPFEELNKEYAYVMVNGGDHILRETTDEKSRWTLQHVNIGTFHRNLLPRTLTYGKKTVQISEEWMRWPGRRSYDGLVFMPEQRAPDRFYNLWRGFAVEPLAKGETPSKESQASLDAFLDHALQNVCSGDAELCRWLIGFFAHMVQKPWEKPLAALVMKGEKGVGKNACVERVAWLLGRHAMVADDDRYLLSNFNDHLENMLFLILDEAAWAGDKKAEGRLKGLITGTSHNIEPKGEKRYEVANLTRVAILGNADWVVPATHDERRFAVFNVGEGRKQDRDFFRQMREGMERGGYRLLLRYLLEQDLSGVNVDAAPRTKGLLEQKLNTLEPFNAWWVACLSEGRIVDSDFGSDWTTQIERDRFRDAFRRYAQRRGVRTRLPDDINIGKQMKKMCPGMSSGRVNTGYVYRFPELDACRAAWSAYIGQEQEWPE